MTFKSPAGILDADLLNYLKTNQVDTLQIKENESERYEIHVILKRSNKPHPILSTRGKPREWASLDRMVKHLKQECFTVKIDWIFFIPPTHKEKKC